MLSGSTSRFLTSSGKAVSSRSDVAERCSKVSACKELSVRFARPHLRQPGTARRRSGSERSVSLEEH